jgi:hypothetical protein
MTAPLLLGRAFRLEGGLGEVNDVSGAFDVFDRSGSEFPPFVREPDFDEPARLYLNKDGLVFLAPGRVSKARSASSMDLASLERPE